ncbi:MAG: hypothetical protein ACR2OO_03755 [Thermomicrobiales bacterium]
MVYKATQDVVRRVMPLLELLAGRTVDKARLLQYLSARSGEDWGALSLVADEEDRSDPRGVERVLVFRDAESGSEHRIRHPSFLPAELEPLVLEEYKRLAMGKALTTMDPRLFDHFFAASCACCRWRGPEHRQIHLECRYAGRPINFAIEPETPEQGSARRPDAGR